MSNAHATGRRRTYKILRLFFSLVADFFYQYIRARLTASTYDFFADSDRNRKRAIRIRTSALEMGGVLVKVGQFLSSRVDLLPTEYIEELALLQDEVPGVSFEEIQHEVEVNLGGPLMTLFAEFAREPIAAASLGQVHRARLPTGEAVAVKVQRPGIAELVEIDLAALRYIVGWLDRHTPLHRRADMPRILKEFEETLRLELDYQREGHHSERIAVSFTGDASVRFPRVYWSHSAGTVLTLQLITGVKITDFQELERRGISRSVVAEYLMRAYMKQILVDGFFHADPHPGNVFVGPGPVVILLDFGMVGEISPEMRENIRRVFVGVIRRDYDDVLNALSRLGFLAPNADRIALKRALIWTVDTFYGLSFGELQAIDPRDVLDALQDVLFAESFQIPANFAFLGRAVGTLSGLCTALDPSFQFVTVAEPFARQLVRSPRGVAENLAAATREAQRLALTAYSLPYLAHGALQSSQNGALDFRSELDRVVTAVSSLERSLRRVLYGLLVTGFLVAGTLVFATHHVYAAMGALFVALVLFVIALAPRRGD